MVELETFLRKKYSETYLNEIFNPSIQKALILETYRGDVVIELFHRDVPLVKEVLIRALLGDFDGMSFHNCNPFFVQLRKNAADIEGKPKQIIPYLRNVRGTVGFVNSKKKANNSLMEHFYVCLKDIPEFDGKYTIIGRVVQGLDVLNKMWDGNTIKAVYVAKNYSKKQKVGNRLSFLFWIGLLFALFYFLRFLSDKISALGNFEESLFGKTLVDLIPYPYDLIIVTIGVLLMLIAVVIAPLARKALENSVESQYKRKEASRAARDENLREQQKLKLEREQLRRDQEEEAAKEEETRREEEKLRKLEEERTRREEEKLRIEEARRNEVARREEEKLRKLEEERTRREEARRRAEELKVKIEEERARREEEKKKLEEERARREEEERSKVEDLRKKLEEERKKIEEEKQKSSELKKYEQLKKKLEEERKKQEEFLKKQISEEQEKRKKLEEESRKKENEMKRKQKEEEDLRAAEEEKKRLEEEEKARKKAAEEDKKNKKLEEERNKRLAEEEKKRKRLEEIMRREQEQELRKKQKIEEKESKKLVVPVKQKEVPVENDEVKKQREQFIGKMGVDVDIKKELKKKDKEEIKQEFLPQIAKRTETQLDVLYDLLENYSALKLSYIIKTFNIEKDEALEWCNILVEHGLAELDYPAFGEPILKKKEK